MRPNKYFSDIWKLFIILIVFLVLPTTCPAGTTGAIMPGYPPVFELPGDNQEIRIAENKGGHHHLEKWYQERWCAAHQGQTEYRVTENGLSYRVDCLTATNAIEFDFAHKWAESLGQAMKYSQLTGKRAGIVMIVEQSDDLGFVQNLENLVNWWGLPVDVWWVDKEGRGQ